MKKTELAFKILGLLTSAGIGVAGLVLEAKRKRTLTEEDKEDIADRVMTKIRAGVEEIKVK